MSDRLQTPSFSPAAKFLHWAVAVLILGLLIVGFRMTGMDFSPLKLQVYGLHKSFGMVVLALALVRVSWRFIDPPPPALAAHASWEKALAKISHLVLYAAMVIMPLSGWAMSSAADFPNAFFGLFDVPDITAKNEDLFEFLRDVHEITAFVILGVLALHMAGALKHHVLDRDATLQRMTSLRLGLIGGLAIGTLFGSLWLGAAFLGVVADDQFAAEIKTDKIAQGAAILNIPDAAMTDKHGWHIIADKSRLRFKATQYGSEFEGSFGAFGGEIVFDPAHLDQSRVNISIDISSVSTGSTDRDSQARTAEWFDVSAYPEATFAAGRFEQIDANHYIAHGSLTIRGVQKPLSLPFSLAINDKGEGVREAKMESDIVLKRLDYGVGQGAWQKTDAIGDEVRLEIRVEAMQGNNISNP